MVCVSIKDGEVKKTFKGFDCAEQLMEFLPSMSIVFSIFRFRWKITKKPSIIDIRKEAKL